MLETPSIPRYSPISVGSDNASGADNQQEILVQRTRILRDHTPDIQSPDWMMRWSPLHGDMQGVASKEVPLRSEQTCPNKTEAKFLVG